MGGELDMFNAGEEEGKVEVKHASEAWKEDNAKYGTAQCTVCDTMFEPQEDAPPIFCPSCKLKLKNLIL